MSAPTKTEDAALKRWAEEQVAAAPPLTDEQRARIAAAFMGGDPR